MLELPTKFAERIPLVSPGAIISLVHQCQTDWSCRAFVCASLDSCSRWLCVRSSICGLVESY